uniref:Uncharacterized protein n=1 Tax=Dendroctonus ponderosae TaxID=77166 RepID=A0AAR5P915_DENPD
MENPSLIALLMQMKDENKEMLPSISSEMADRKKVVNEMRDKMDDNAQKFEDLKTIVEGKLKNIEEVTDDLENTEIVDIPAVVEETLTAAKVKEVVKTESIAILESQDEHAEEFLSDKVTTDKATIVKTEELSVADETVSDKIEDITRPMEHEYVTMQKNTQNLLKSAKTKPEIMLRWKTVEPDLEKLVCLGEESSDSECNGPTSDKPVHDSPALDEDANLIQIATEVAQFSDPELPIERHIPIEENAPAEAQPDVDSINASSNLETLLAVASLQNESVVDTTREHRR